VPTDQITVTTYRIEQQGRLFTVVRRDSYGIRGRQGYKDRVLGAYQTRKQAQARINEIRSKRTTL
jgi:hypothetical protein